MAMNSNQAMGIDYLNQGFWNATNLGWNSIQNMKDREWQAKFWKATYDKTLKDNLMYNSPSAQIARLRAAGVNANLAYTQGVGTQPFSLNGDSGAMTSRGAAAVSSVSAMDNLLKAAQARNLDADSENKLAQNDLIKSQTDAQKIANSFAGAINQATLDNLRKDVEAKDVNIKSTLKQIEVATKSMELTDAQIKELKAKVQGIVATTKFQEAVNEYKIPFLKNGINPDESPARMLFKFLATCLVGWTKKNDSFLGQLWDAFKEYLTEVKDGVDDSLEEFKDYFK